MNNQLNWRDLKTILRGTDPTVNATAPNNQLNWRNLKTILSGTDPTVSATASRGTFKPTYNMASHSHTQRYQH